MGCRAGASECARRLWRMRLNTAQCCPTRVRPAVVQGQHLHLLSSEAGCMVRCFCACCRVRSTLLLLLVSCIRLFCACSLASLALKSRVAINCSQLVVSFLSVVTNVSLSSVVIKVTARSLTRCPLSQAERVKLSRTESSHHDFSSPGLTTSIHTRVHSSLSAPSPTPPQTAPRVSSLQRVHVRSHPRNSGSTIPRSVPDTG